MKSASCSSAVRVEWSMCAPLDDLCRTVECVDLVALSSNKPEVASER